MAAMLQLSWSTIVVSQGNVTPLEVAHKNKKKVFAVAF
jgi:hypothetical protein